MRESGSDLSKNSLFDTAIISYKFYKWKMEKNYETFRIIGKMQNLKFKIIFPFN